MTDHKLLFLAEPQTGPVGGGTGALRALSRGFDRAGIRRVDHRRRRVVREVARVFSKLRLQRNLCRLGGRTYLVALMWPNDHRMFPFSYLFDLVPYVFDCWPDDYPRWEALFRRHRTRLAFFSARGSAEHFRARLPRMASHWVPEACDPEDYDTGGPLASRGIDVLELGRKLAAYHQAIAPHLEERGRRFVYSTEGSRTFIFPDHAALRAGLADSKISVCFPKCMTHPSPVERERGAGDLETVTLRYFEGMASRCLLIGHGPRELEDLFGWNPVIEADLGDPVGQIREILASIDGYQEQVDRNHRRLLEVGTWDVRVAEMLRLLGRA